MRAWPLILLEVPVLLLAGCISAASLEHMPTSTPQLPDRTECGEILGSAFRSDTERAWFAENCSAWAETTLGEVTVAPAEVPPASTPAQPQGENSGQPPTDTPPPPTDTPAPQPTHTPTMEPPQPTAAAESRNCDEIRGRPYASEEQRQWYLANCSGTQAGTQGGPDQAQPTPAPPAQAPAQPAVGPDGRPCSAIYGTRYLSGAERRWFEVNCL